MIFIMELCIVSPTNIRVCSPQKGSIYGIFLLWQLQKWLTVYSVRESLHFWWKMIALQNLSKSVGRNPWVFLFIGLKKGPSAELVTMLKRLTRLNNWFHLTILRNGRYFVCTIQATLSIIDMLAFLIKQIVQVSVPSVMIPPRFLSRVFLP